jgi:hypothetical protein
VIRVHRLPSCDENTTETLILHAAPTADNRSGRGGERRCVFLVPGRRFCGAPTTRGSAYCARHRALCTVAPGSPEGRRILDDLDAAARVVPPPPPELATLATVALAEADGPEPDLDFLSGVATEDAR